MLASETPSGDGSPIGAVVRRALMVVGVVVIAVGVLVLAGWALGSGVLKSVISGLPAMKANTAVAMVCAGSAVLCLGPGTSVLARRVGRLLGVLVGLFGALVIWEYVVGGVGIDQAVFHDAAGSFPGRPSPETALAMMTLGLALALATVDGGGRWRRAHVVLQAIAATVVLFGVVGDIYGVAFLRGGSGVSGIGVNTLFALVLLTLAVGYLGVDDGVALWLQGNDSGARMGRALLPVVIAGPLLLGGLPFAAQELGWIGLRVGLSVYTLSMIFVLAIIVVVVARRLRGSDLELRRLAAIVDASDDAMINKTAEGIILSWNRAAERMYGYSADEVVGRSVSILAPADRRDEIPALLDRVKRGEVQRVETERVCREGTRLSVALTVSPIRDQTSRVVGASTTARDITERKESERRLEHTARLLAEAQAIAGLGSWELDMQDGSATWTDQVFEIFGTDRDRVADDPAALRELVDADDRESYDAMLAGVRTTGTSDAAVFAIRRPDGERRILQSRARLAARDGRAKLVGTVMDITENRGLQQQLTAARDLFGGVLDAATEMAIVATDPDGVITVFNRGAERMLGRSAAEMIGRETPTLFHDPAEVATRATEIGIEPGFEVFVQRARAGASETREWSYLHADGHRLTVSLTVTAVRGEREEITGFIGVARDVTEVRLAEAARRQAEQRFAAAFEHAPIGVAITGMRGADRGRYLHANEAFARLVGRDPGGLDGMAFPELTHPDDVEDSTEAFAQLERGETIEIEKRYLHRDGHVISVLVSATPIFDETDRQVSYCVSQVLDLSARKRFESQLRHLADHDALTGLHNRQRFESELARIVDENRRYRRRFALLALDLDGFKTINDRFGHPVGDELLARISGLLRHSVRDSDIIARVGGDEFAIILHEAGEPEAITVAEKVLDAIRRGGLVQHGTRQARVTSSIGIATLDADSRLTGEELVVEADTAMYDAKSEGRDRYSVYDRATNRRAGPSKCHSWLERLRHAIDNDLFVLHAQAIVGICANGIPRYELLVRMLDDDGELIFPAEFIDTAERFGLIGSIDRWVLRNAVKLLHDYTAAGHNLCLAVNLSASTMNDLNLVKDLAAMIAEYPIPDGRLVIEVTEATAIVNVDRARDRAAELGKLGCRFALDDFDAGFASFHRLRHLKFDNLKIDGKFITKLTDNTTDQLIVKALVGIAHGVGTTTVAEFVGDDATLHLLRELGVDYGQGYYLGHPGPINARLPAMHPPPLASATA